MKIANLLAGMIKPTNQLQKAFERVDEVVTRIGFGSSLRLYKPHVTLGRFKDKNRTYYSFEEFNDIQIKSRVNVLDVYESEFDKGKTEYKLIEKLSILEVRS